MTQYLVYQLYHILKNLLQKNGEAKKKLPTLIDARAKAPIIDTKPDNSRPGKL